MGPARRKQDAIWRGCSMESDVCRMGGQISGRRSAEDSHAHYGRVALIDLAHNPPSQRRFLSNLAAFLIGKRLSLYLAVIKFAQAPNATAAGVFLRLLIWLGGRGGYNLG
jgi:hypothetical protein